MGNTETKIIKIARRIAHKSIMVTSQSTIESMNFDSFDCVNFIVAIEDKFNIRIDVSESMEFGTISCMAKMVDNKVQRKVKIAA